MAICSYCRVPLPGEGLTGRAWPDRPAAVYCCYGCLSLGEERLARGESPHSIIEGPWFRLGLSLFLAGQAMTFGLAVNLSPTTAQERSLLQAGVCLAGSLVVLLLGGPLLKTSWSDFRRGSVTVEALFLISALGAYGVSLQSYVTGSGPIYFEVVAILLVVYTLGKIGPALVRHGALASAQVWAATLATCRLADGEQGRNIPVGEVHPGDEVLVHPGEVVAVDGTVIDGTGFLQDAPLTGEPFARLVRPGDGVLAGSISQDASFRIRSDAPGTQRMVDRLLAAVEEARHRPTSIQMQVDRWARRFVPLVVLAALGTFLFWSRTTDAATGWLHGMSVLLVACPCALGLATPLVVWLTLARLAEQGLIVRQGDFVERLAGVDRVLFDKTGTLTDHLPGTVDLVTTATGEERKMLLARIAAAQGRSRHPIAQALRNLAESNRSWAGTHIEVKEIPGNGIVAHLRDAQGDHQLRIGHPDWFPQPVNHPSELVEHLGSDLGQRVVVEENGKIVGVAILAESLREGTREAVDSLEALGLPATLLTGDPRSRNVASELAPCRTGLLPEDKLREVEAIRSLGGRPLFVGDGVNDAGALGNAWAGIALSSGSDLAADASGAVLYRHDLRVIPWAVTLCRTSITRLSATIQGALLYNLAGMILAATGLLHPVAAAILMACSSLFVAWSATRVGVASLDHSPDHGCDDSRTHGSFAPFDGLHGLALALQGPLLVLLAGTPFAESKVPLVGFLVAGLALVWIRLQPLGRTHGGEMASAMAGLGGLGMVAGWWADTGFEGGLCCCSLNLASIFASPGMYLGMTLLGSLAMLLGPHGASAAPGEKRSMLAGGNLGMIGGMMLGAWLARSIPAVDTTIIVLVDYFGMMIGMTMGMFLGDFAWKRLERTFQAFLTTPLPSSGSTHPRSSTLP